MLTLIFSSLLFTNVVTMPEAPKWDMAETLAKIAYCESRNRNGIINENDYGSPSFGKYQFKIQTFVWAGRKYDLPHGDIWSEEQQEAILKALIENRQAHKHWKVCWKIMNLNYE